MNNIPQKRVIRKTEKDFEREIKTFFIDLYTLYSIRTNDTCLDADFMAVKSSGMSLEGLKQAFAVYKLTGRNTMPTVGDLVAIPRGAADDQINHDCLIAWNKLIALSDSRFCLVFLNCEMKSAFLSCFGTVKHFLAVTDRLDRQPFAFKDFKAEYKFALMHGSSVDDPYIIHFGLNQSLDDMQDNEFIFLFDARRVGNNPPIEIYDAREFVADYFKSLRKDREAEQQRLLQYEDAKLKRYQENKGRWQNV